VVSPVSWKRVATRGPEGKRREQLLNLPLAVTSTADLALDALDLARAHDIAVYDASYLALAIREAIEPGATEARAR
jgi:predicted nucleic acid-binding protein